MAKLQKHLLLLLKDSRSAEPQHHTLCIIILKVLAICPSLVLSVMTTSICCHVHAALEGLSVPVV